MSRCIKMNDNMKMANLLFPNIKLSVADLEKRFPVRKEKTFTTRFAPSPTGFLHIGGVYTAMMNEKIAHQNGGTFILRIEDTDQKREVPNAKGIICSILKELGLQIDEGVISETEQVGAYGSYIQSERVEIYHTVAKMLVEKGLAYPCFCSEDELNEIRHYQEEKHLAPGYYREFAKYRNITFEEAEKLLKEKGSFVLRFRVPDQIPERVSFDDEIKGHIEMENNINDLVLLKENGIPTYHFAHCCDDHFMRTTLVMRGDEWLMSFPIHKQLFEACGFELPKYAHVAPIMKLDGESRRKLSKRKDPESNAEFYLENGYPVKSLYAYLYTLINSNFEAWYLENPDKDLKEFLMSTSNMSISGALYDLDKLNNISSEIIYNTSVMDNVHNLLAWAKKYNTEQYARFNNDLEFVKRIFMTQGPDSSEHRKDLACYSEFMNKFGSLYLDVFEAGNDFYQDMLDENLPLDKRSNVVLEYINYFKDKEQGSERTLKDLCKDLGYVDKKKYMKNPELYQGVTTNFYKGLRLILTHEEHGISMDDVVLVLGYDEVIRRLELFK